MNDNGIVRRAAKVGHRKSRNGCAKCKTRRVKCDEVRPVCSNCLRLKLECAWPSAESRHNHGHGGQHAAAPETLATSAPTSSTITASTSAQSHRSKSTLRSPTVTSHVSPGTFSAGSTDGGDPGDGGDVGDGGDTGDGGEGNGSSSWQHSHHTSPPGEDRQKFSAILELWSSNTEPRVMSASPVTSMSSILNPVVDEHAESDCLLPESRERRMLEHRLFQNYMYNLGIPFPISPSQSWNNVWLKIIPPMALQFDNVLYAMMAHSATHMLRQEPGDQVLFHARQAYLVAAMRVQRRMLQSLTKETADAVFLASLIMLVQAFAMLDERVMDTYTPPMDWLRLGKGAGTVIWTSLEAIVKEGRASESESVMMSIANSQPRMGYDEAYFDASNRDQMQLRGILDQDLVSGDDWKDAATREAYEKTLSFVGSLQLAIRDNEPLYVLCRRIQGFTMVIPTLFIEFVAMRRPRALVILAHFFAAVHQLSGKGVWWLGGEGGKESIARREVRGIRTIMPDEWIVHMIWPSEATGDTLLNHAGGWSRTCA